MFKIIDLFVPKKRENCIQILLVGFIILLITPVLQRERHAHLPVTNNQPTKNVTDRKFLLISIRTTLANYRTRIVPSADTWLQDASLFQANGVIQKVKFPV